METRMHFDHGALPGSLELAYLGDTVYDLFVRRHLVEQGGKVRALHGKAVRLVCAHAQSEALRRVEDSLTEAESDVVRRARNHKITSKPKNADPVTYKMATAFEALLGYLYLDGQEDRLQAVMERAARVIEEA